MDLSSSNYYLVIFRSLAGSYSASFLEAEEVHVDPILYLQLNTDQPRPKDQCTPPKASEDNSIFKRKVVEIREQFLWLLDRVSMVWILTMTYGTRYICRSFKTPKLINNARLSPAPRLVSKVHMHHGTCCWDIQPPQFRVLVRSCEARFGGQMIENA